MKRLSKDQFRDAIRKGLGRTIVHLKNFDASGMEDTIADACIRSLVYDPQCEGTRGWWLYRILKVTGLSRTVMPKVVAALLQPSTKEDYWDVAQRYELAAFAAEEGYEDARTAIYDKFGRREFSAVSLGGTQIVFVDGLNGLLRVAEIIGSNTGSAPERWDHWFFISEAYKRLGRDAVRNALLTQSQYNENIQRYRDLIDQIEHQEAERKSAQKKPLEPVERIIDDIDALQVTSRVRLFIWGRWASIQDIAILCDHMAAEKRSEQLRLYLQVFNSREMPWIPPQILELAHTEDEHLRRALTEALSNSRNPTLRDLGLRMLRHSPPRFEAIRLFEKNFEAGDARLLKSLLPTEEDVDRLHRIGLDLLAIIQEVHEPEFVDCLLWLYEYTPCSMCRSSALRRLVEMKAAPIELIDECRWDCDGDTRDLAESSVRKES